MIFLHEIYNDVKHQNIELLVLSNIYIYIYIYREREREMLEKIDVNQ